MTKDMTSGAITPLLIKFTIPLVLGNLFQLTYNAADSIIVGKFVGEDALAAVGTSNPLMTLAILFINGMCLGAGILVSTAFGAGDTELVERQVSTTAIAGTVFSLTFSALCVLLADPLLRLLQVPVAILPIAVNYLRIVFAGLIFTFFYNFLAATMRALGDSKSALYFLMISAVLNIGGDLFFVEALGWGSEGCALSTVLSEAACCLLCVVYIRYKVPILQLGRRWLVYDGKLVVYDEAYMESQQPVDTITITPANDFEYRDEGTNAYGSAEAVNGGLTGTFAAPNGGDKVLRRILPFRMTDQSEADRFAKGLLRDANKNATVGTLWTGSLLRDYAAGSVVTLATEGVKSWDGTAFINRIRHDYVKTRSKLYLRKPLEGY